LIRLAELPKGYPSQMFSLFGIRRRMAFSFSVFLVIVSIASVWGIMTAVTNASRENITRQQTSMITMLASSIDDKLGLYLSALSDLSTTVKPYHFSTPARAQAFLEDRKVIKGLFNNGIYLIDAQQNIVAESPQVMVRQNPRVEELVPFLKSIAENGMPDISDLYFSPRSQGAAILMAAPIYDSNNRLFGYLAGSLNLVNDYFIEEVMTHKIGNKGYLYLFNTNRTMVVHPDKTRIMKQDVPRGVNVLYDKASEGFEGSGETVNSRGIAQIASFKRLRMTNWILASTYPIDEAYEPIRHLFWHHLLPGAVLLTLLSLLLVWSLSSRLTAKLNTFTEQIGHIRTHPEERHEIRITSNDEVGVLAESFNKLIKSLDEKESLLHEAEDRLSRALQGSNDGIWDWDMASEKVFYSPHFIDMLGYPPDEFKPTIDSWAMLIHQQDRDRVWDLFRKHFERETAFFTSEHRILCKSGEYRWFLARGLAWHGPDNSVVRMAGSLSDINDSKLIEEELVTARAASDSANRAKSEFLATMSHEIRTPMNGIVGMGELLSGTELSIEQREYLKNITISADNLLAIINDILDFSKIEAGKMELESIPFKLRSTFGQTARALGVKAAAKGVEVMLDIAPDVPDHVLGDPIRLRQIITNLAGNAIKFTDQGDVVISITAEEPRNDTVRLNCSVRDTGIGISAEQLRRIFSPFTQADGSTTRRFGGTGLGLSITRRLVDLMDGELTVESTPGAGSTFRVAITCALQPEQQQVPHVAQNLEGRKVFVVDDNAINRSILAGFCRVAGLECRSADCGASALESLLAAGKQGWRPDVILMDIHMPEMDGWETSARIRSNPALSDCRIIVMTSGTSRQDSERRQSLRIDGNLLKPLIQDELYESISRVFRVSGPEAVAPTAARSAEAQTSRRLSILVAEDAPINQKLIERVLEKQGHTITIANNGEEAVQLWRHAVYDLVLMDIEMPVMDGYSAAAAIRSLEQEQGGHIPIAAMTAHVLPGDIEKCLTAGMDAYISKPFKSSDVRDAITRLTGHPDARPTAG